MSEKETAKIDALEKKAENLEQKVEQIYTAISGDTKLGLKGLVDTLNDHVAQSKKNNEVLLSEFKNFKRDLVLDYANDFNTMNDRIKPLEKEHNRRYNVLGFFTGIGVLTGAIITHIKDIFKWIFE